MDIGFDFLFIKAFPNLKAIISTWILLWFLYSIYLVLLFLLLLWYFFLLWHDPCIRLRLALNSLHIPGWPQTYLSQPPECRDYIQLLTQTGLHHILKYILIYFIINIYHFKYIGEKYTPTHMSEVILH